MLDFFRRQKSNLRWIWIILIGVFSVTLVTMYIPAGDLGSVSLTTDVAEVGDESVSAREFQTAYRNYLNQVRSQLTPELIQAFQFDRQIVDSLVDEYVMIAEAKRLGLAVSAVEIERKILESPIFLEGDSFIGLERYETVLLQNNLTVEEFESNVRNQILLDKLFSFLTSPASVSNEEVENEYRNRNESVQLDYFVVDAPDFEDDVELSAEAQQEFFESNLARYTIPERRSALYIYVDTVKIRTEMEPVEGELLAYYEENKAAYALPARVRAQHILFKTEGMTPEEVAAIRDSATDVVTRAKSGEDFGELAREFSEDTSASNGGDLGYFGTGQMVPEFESVAFNLGVGGTSDLVETDFGIHIIRVNEREDQRIRPFEEVRIAIESLVMFRQAADSAAQIAQSIAVELLNNDDFEAVARARGAEIRETGLIARGEGLEEFTDRVELESQIFGLQEGAVGSAIAVSNGYVIPSVVEIQPAHQASFEEVADVVSEDLRAEKARELAEERAEEIRSGLAEGQSFEAVARTAGLEIKSSEALTRGGSIEEFGSTNTLDRQIFSLDTGVPGTPVTVAGKTIAFVVTDKQEVDPVLMQAGFEDLHTELLFRKKDQLFAAYNREVRKRMEDDGEIVINDVLVGQIAATIG